MTQEKTKLNLKKIAYVSSMIVLSFALLVLFTFIYQLISSEAHTPNTIGQTQETTSPIPATGDNQATPTPTTSDYRTILLLERSADLLLTYIDKVRAGEISIDDLPARQPYTLALSVAIDAYNQTTPSEGMIHAWKNVIKVATAYSLVYPILIEGKMISTNDLTNLKFSRQWLTNYQHTEEAILSASGKGSEYFAAERQAVEQLLQKNYGDIPLPTP